MKSTSPIRLLALDLDGTLLTGQKHLSERTKYTLIAAKEAGIELVFVTGRPLKGLPEEAMAVPGIRYVITSNGAVTTDLQNSINLRSALINNALAQEIVREPEARGFLYNIFIDGLGYSPAPVYEKLLQTFDGTPQEKYVRQSRRPVEALPKTYKASENNVENIWIRAFNRGQRDELHAQIREIGGLQTVLTAETDIEVGADEADKGLALSELAETLRIGKSSILAIGDNENDLGMFRAAGFSAAMGNASAFVKQKADFVTDSNEEDGAAKIIEKLCGLRL